MATADWEAPLPPPSPTPVPYARPYPLDSWRRRRRRRRRRGGVDLGAGIRSVNAHGDGSKAGQQFWNSTVMSWLHGAKELWKNLRIEVLVSLAAGVLLFLAIFGSQRRRSRNWFLQKGVFGAFTLSFSMASYIPGSMQSSGVKSNIYPVWAISLFMLHACTDSVTAYSLDDNAQKTKLIYQAYMYYAYAGSLLITVQNCNTVLVWIAVIAFVRYEQKVAACMLASRSWNLNKMVNDYMYNDGKHNKSVFDPATMEGCNYPVDWHLSKSKFDAPSTVEDPSEDEIIDIGKIWQFKDKSDKSLGPELKDACLSFSLFHLLRRRYFGFACDESKHRAHDFDFKGLLSDGAMDCNRIFKVIEVELAFMYDFFFTKYAVIYYGSVAATIWSLLSVIGISITAYTLLPGLQ